MSTIWKPSVTVAAIIERDSQFLLVEEETSEWIRSGKLGQLHDRVLDFGILRAVWMSHEELLACETMHRSPLVLQCVNDYLAGKRSPLSTLYTHPSVTGLGHDR